MHLNTVCHEDESNRAPGPILAYGYVAIPHQSLWCSHLETWKTFPRRITSFEDPLFGIKDLQYK